MANELVHTDAGTQLSRTEDNATTRHKFNSQAQGDVLYASSATQLTRLGAGTVGLHLITGGSSANPSWSTRQQLTIEAHTADDTLTIAESGSVHTNLGDTGAQTLTLPQDAVAGTFFYFAVMAAFELRVDPGAAGAIYINGAKQTDDMYITANDEGESVMLVCDGNGDWVALFTQGTWGVET